MTDYGWLYEPWPRIEKWKGCRPVTKATNPPGVTLTERVRNALGSSFSRWMDVLLMTPPQLLRIRNLGPASLRDLQCGLAEVGLALAPEPGRAMNRLQVEHVHRKASELLRETPEDPYLLGMVTAYEHVLGIGNTEP